MERENEKTLGDCLRETLMDFIYGGTSLEDANNLWLIFHYIDQMETRINDLDAERKALHKRAILAEMALKSYEEES